MEFRRLCAALLAAVLLLPALSGCGKAGDVSGVERDYGTSHVFMRQEVDDAANLVLDEFKSWKGCQLYSIRYAGDACNNEMNVRRINVMWHGKEGLDQHIEFITRQYISKSAPKSLGLEPDKEYNNIHWHLGRGADDEWHLIYWRAE